MGQVVTIGLDLAKSVFQLAVADGRCLRSARGGVLCRQLLCASSRSSSAANGEKCLRLSLKQRLSV